jgi:hypothetical protein
VGGGDWLWRADFLAVVGVGVGGVVLQWPLLLAACWGVLQWWLVRWPATWPSAALPPAGRQCWHSRCRALPGAQRHPPACLSLLLRPAPARPRATRPPSAVAAQVHDLLPPVPVPARALAVQRARAGAGQGLRALLLPALRGHQVQGPHPAPDHGGGPEGGLQGGLQGGGGLLAPVARWGWHILLRRSGSSLALGPCLSLRLLAPRAAPSRARRRCPCPAPQVCASCRDICNCKKCLQTRNPVSLPTYSAEQQRECAAYLLACVSSPLGDLLEEWGAEVGTCHLSPLTPGSAALGSCCACPLSLSHTLPPPSLLAGRGGGPDPGAGAVRQAAAPGARVLQHLRHVHPGAAQVGWGGAGRVAGRVAMRVALCVCMCGEGGGWWVCGCGGG